MKIEKRPTTILYPVPVILVTCIDQDGKPNIITIAWAGTVCSIPPMVGISIRPSRYSHELIISSREFVVNIPTSDQLQAVDYCGMVSGRDVDKFKETGLTLEKAQIVRCPLIKESPVNIECKVHDIIKLGSHDMFLAEVVAVNVDDKYMDEKGKFHLDHAKPICYSHGEYYGLKKRLGYFGFSVAKKKAQKK
jgi:flavin reductase (DIM6/NTAB) family NADH-FMN oxidoreductase RutF